MIQVNGEAKVLTAESKPYSFNGNSGTSHKVRLLVDGEIYVVTSSEAQVESLKPYVDKDIKVRLAFQSRKERLSLTLEDFHSLD